MSKVYLPGKNGQVMQIDYATMERLRKKKEEQKKREEELKRKSEEEERRKLQALIEEQQKKEKEARDFHIKRKMYIKYGFAKKVIEIGMQELDRQAELELQRQQQQSLNSLTSVTEEDENELVTYDRLSDIHKKYQWVEEKPKKIKIKAQNVTTDQKIQEIMQILKFSKLQFQQQMGENYDIFEYMPLQKTSLNNTLNTSVVSHKKPFRPQVPVGKLFKKEQLLVHKDDDEVQQDLIQVKMEKSLGKRAKSHSPDRNKNVKKEDWKPGKYYPSLFRQEPLLVHKTQYEKVFPHSQYKNYLPTLEKLNQTQDVSKIKEEDDQNYKFLNESQKKSVKERLLRYETENNQKNNKLINNNDKNLPALQQKNSKSPEKNKSENQKILREKMWRPQNSVNKPFEKERKLLIENQENKKTKNMDKSNSGSQFLENSVSTNAFNSTQSVKRVQYPIIVDEKQKTYSFKKDFSQRSLSPKKQIVYKPYFKDLHNFNSQNQFDKKMFNDF